MNKLPDTSPLSHLSETLIGSEIVKLGGEIKERIKKGEKIFIIPLGFCFSLNGLSAGSENDQRKTNPGPLALLKINSSDPR
jgi:hypothetical protein